MKSLVLTAAVSLLSFNAFASNIYVSDGAGQLAVVDSSTGAVSNTVSVGTVMFDIAFDNSGALWGVDSGNLFQIDASTGSTTFVGGLGTFANALTFDSAGNLFAAGGSGLYSVNTTTGAASLIGNTGFSSGGDLAFDGAGNLFLSDAAGNLIGLDTSTGAGTLIGNTGYSSVYGLAFVDSTMYGVAGTDVFSIDTTTGSSTFGSDYTGQGLSIAYGASSLQSIAVPEPMTAAIFGLGLLGFGMQRKRKA